MSSASLYVQDQQSKMTKLFRSRKLDWDVEAVPCMDRIFAQEGIQENSWDLNSSIKCSLCIEPRSI